MRNLFKILFCICLAVLAVSTPIHAQATETAGFTVRAVLPENQVDGGNSYFDLRMNPGKSQDIQVEVLNTSDTAMVLDVSLHAASTNRNGIIEYLIENEHDETMRFPFSSIAKTEAEIPLGPNEKKRATIRIDMPAEQFDGEILGGVVFTKRSGFDQAQGIGINNLFSYVIGVRLTETDKAMLPDFDLKSVQETLINYRTAVAANIRNTEPVIVKGASVSAQIYKNDDTSPLFSAEKPNVDFAPNSVFPMHVEWGGQQLESGNYRMSVQLVHNEKLWEWDHNFTISQSQAKEINDGAVPKAQAPAQSAFYRYIFIILAIILVLAAFYLGRKSKKANPDEQVR